MYSIYIYIYRYAQDIYIYIQIDIFCFIALCAQVLSCKVALMKASRWPAWSTSGHRPCKRKLFSNCCRSSPSSKAFPLSFAALRTWQFTYSRELKVIQWKETHQSNMRSSWFLWQTLCNLFASLSFSPDQSAVPRIWLRCKAPAGRSPIHGEVTPVEQR